MENEVTNAAAAAKKSNVLLKTVLIIVGCLVAVAIGLQSWFWISERSCRSVFDSIHGTFVSTFGKPEDIREFAQERAVREMMYTYSDFYGQYTEIKDDIEEEGIGCDGDASIEISDSFVELATQSSDNVNIPEKLEMEISTDIKDSAYSINTAIIVDNDTLLTLDAMFDIETGKLYCGIPELNKKYIDMDLYTLLENEANQDTSSYSYSQYDAATSVNSSSAFATGFTGALGLADALPSDEEVTKLVERYAEIVIENLGDTDKDSKTLKAGGVSQKVNALSVDISYETLYDIAEAVLKEAKHDDDLEKLICDVLDDCADFLKETGVEMTTDEIYDKFVEAIDEAIDALDDAKPDDEKLGEFITYVTKSGKVCGFAFKSDDFNAGVYVTQSGKEVGFKCFTEGVFEAEGSGTIKSGKFSGKFTVENEDEKYATIELDELNIKKALKGYLSGSITILPEGDMMPEDFNDLAIKISVNMDDKSAGFLLDLTNDGSSLVKFSAVLTKRDYEEFSVPKDTYKISDTDDLADWVADIDEDTLADLLDKFGMDDMLSSSTQDEIIQEAWDAYKEMYAMDYSDGVLDGRDENGKLQTVKAPNVGVTQYVVDTYYGDVSKFTYCNGKYTVTYSNGYWGSPVKVN